MEIDNNENEIKDNNNEIIDNNNEIKNNENEIKDNENEINEEEDIFLNNDDLLTYFLKQKKENELILDKNDNKNIIKDNSYNNYLDSLTKELQKTKEKTISYFKELINVLEKKYNTYIIKLTEIIKQKEKEIKDIILTKKKKINMNSKNIIMKLYTKIFYNKIDDIKDLHNSIFATIESNICLLDHYLDDFSLFSEKYPIEQFLNKNIKKIEDSFILKQINYTKVNYSTSIINDELLKLLSQNLDILENNNFKSITLNKNINNKKEKDNKNINNIDKSIKDDKDYLYKVRALENNIKKIHKLKLINLVNDEIYDILLNYLKKNNIDNNNICEIKLDSIKNIHFINCKVPDNNLFQNKEIIHLNIPNIIKIKIQDCKLQKLSYFLPLIKNARNLKNIYMENINLTQNNYLYIFNQINSNVNIINSLEYISFSNNDISKVDFNYFQNLINFRNLKYIDFSKNNIYYFNEENLNYLPSVKIIDLSYNNISNAKLFNNNINKKKPILIFFSSNLFLINNESNKKKYINYLINYFSSTSCEVPKTLNLSFLFDKNNIEDLNKFYISPIIRLSLIKLDLSYNYLTSAILKKFFDNNKGIISLQSLILNHNNIDFNFFKDVLALNELNNIKIIDLAFNNIDYNNYKDIEVLEHFLETRPNLEAIHIQKNPFFNCMVINIDYDKENIYKRLEKLEIYKTKFVIEEPLIYLALEENKIKKNFIFKNDHLKL